MDTSSTDIEPLTQQKVSNISNELAEVTDIFDNDSAREVAAILKYPAKSVI